MRGATSCAGRPTRATPRPHRRAYTEEFVEHDLYGQRYTGTPLFFYRHYDAPAVQRRLLAPCRLEVVERGVWTKRGVRESADAAGRVVPRRAGIGRALGPGLIAIGAWTMRDGDPDDLATDNVMRLALRRPGGPPAA
jgi:hypothetical protein